ncbi:MAG: hypothetical protein R2879_13960 [Saprospiraceae bacterium]
MGFLNEFKKLFFGAKSVTKSAADKAMESGKEKAAEFADKANDYTNKAIDELEEMSKKAQEKAGESWEKTKDYAEEVGEKVLKKSDEFWDKAEQKYKDLLGDDEEATETSEATFKESPTENFHTETPKEHTAFSEEFGEEPVSRAGNKTAESLENLGKKVLEKSDEINEKLADKAGQAWDKTKDYSEKVGGMLFEKGSDLYEKAKKYAEESGEKLEDLIEKANKAAQEAEDKVNQKGTEFSEKVHDTKETFFDKHDDFFSKAQRYADGDNHAFDKKPRVIVNPDQKKGETSSKEERFNELLEGPGDKPNNKGSIKGFDDTDGDGDSLIDDAIVEE